MKKPETFSRLALTRRDAIKVTAAAAAGAAALGPGAILADPGLPAVPTGPGHVVKVTKPGMMGRSFPRADAAREAVNRAVTTLAREDDLGRAWARFVSKEDRVGIKINVLGGKLASTMKEVVDPIVEGVRAAGVADENIMIFDQFGGNMRVARYEWQERPGRLRVLNHAVLGYESDYTEAEGARGRLSKALTWSTAIVNVPVIKDHDLVGVTCTIKNMVCGCVEKPQLMHREAHVGLPHFYAREELRGRVRLHLVDGSFCLYDRGPKQSPSTQVAHDSVYATTDPVAMDTIALELVEELRHANRLRSLAEVRRPATYLGLAEELGLGIHDRRRIHLETVDLPPVVEPTS